MTGIGVRRATVADLPALAALQRRTALHAYAHIFPAEAPPPTLDEIVAQWAAALEGGRAGFVAVPAPPASSDDTDPAGVVGLVAAARDDDGVGLLARLYVAPEWWGRGVGRTLHDCAVDHLRAAGCEAARLWVLERNERARAWYERLGWQPTGGRKAVYVPAAIYDAEYRRALAPG